jgi:UDP-N-acetylmuramoyl-tripeptide--D-alanyl-D-alanine ligase
VGVFNGDDPQVRAMLDRNYPRTRLMVTQHEVPGARLCASHVQMRADGLHFDVRDTETGAEQALYAPLYGETNVTNILMAAAVALHLGMSLEEIAARAATLEPAEHRLVRRVLPNGTVVIDDAYSANPVGTKAALEVLKLHTQSRHRVVVSSGMFELGPAQEQENYRLGQRIAAAATDVILIGAKQVAPLKAGLLAGQFPADRLHVVETLREAMALYPTILQPGDTLLVLTDLPDTYAS